LDDFHRLVEATALNKILAHPQATPLIIAIVNASDDHRAWLSKPSIA
jgi:hypothetical protein